MCCASKGKKGTARVRGPLHGSPRGLADVPLGIAGCYQDKEKPASKGLLMQNSTWSPCQGWGRVIQQRNGRVGREDAATLRHSRPDGGQKPACAHWFHLHRKTHGSCASPGHR